MRLIDGLVYCLTVRHDVRFVILSVAVCLLSTMIAWSLVSRAWLSSDSVRARWVLAAGAVLGSGVWVTHFIAMLAYTSSVPLGFDLTITTASAVIGIAFDTVGIALLVDASGVLKAAFGGAIIGAGIAAMHFVGMEAVLVPGTIDVDQSMAAASLLVGLSAAALAAVAMAKLRQQGGQIVAALLLSLGILGLHFLAMSAITIRLDPLATVADDSAGRQSLALAIAGVMVAILALAVVGARIDQILAKRALRAANRLSALANAALGGIVICRRGAILEVNQNFATLLGYDAAALTGRALTDFVGEIDRGTVGQALAEDRNSVSEIELCARDGSPIPVEIVIQPVEDDEGRQAIVAMRDLRERRAAEARVRHFARSDALTGLANRAAFRARLDDELASAERNHGRLALHVIDLDDFKEINDSYGPAAGDEILRGVARILETVAGPRHVVARYGGDEFVVIQRRVGEPHEVAALAGRIVGEIGGLALPETGGRGCDASVGVALFPDDAGDAEELIRNADMALFRAKSEGKKTVRIFEAAMAGRTRQHRTLQRDLQQAVEKGELTFVFQPQCRLPDRELVGFEALVRWTHPVFGAIPPSTFIPLAERGGFIDRLGETMLREVCGAAAKWPRPLKVAVNLSAVQLANDNLDSLLHGILVETGLAAERLEIEVTESVLIEDIARGLQALRRLKALGVKIAMDDFGTGYSSLNYLQAFPFDKIKIDRSFIENIEQNAHSRAIVRAVVGLGKGIGVPVAAEGVETEAQLRILAMEGCAEVQGYLTGRPIALDGFFDELHDPGPRQSPPIRLVATA